MTPVKNRRPRHRLTGRRESRGELRNHRRIVRCEICAGEREIQNRLPLRFIPIARAKCALPLRIIFLPVKPAVPPEIQSVLLLHVFLQGEENARAEFFPLRSSRGVLAEFARIVSACSIFWQFRWHFVSETVFSNGESPRCEAIIIWLQR
jgi:hypothetical protein